MLIGDFSRRTGVSIDTLRYYERVGLIPRAGRDARGRRNYSEDHLRWMSFLEVLKSTGMGIADMRRYVDLRASGVATIADRLSMLQAHRAKISAQRQHLAEAEALLDAKIELFRSVADGSIGPEALTCDTAAEPETEEDFS